MFTKEERDLLLIILQMNKQSIIGGIIKAKQLRPGHENEIDTIANSKISLMDSIERKIKNSPYINK